MNSVRCSRSRRAPNRVGFNSVPLGALEEDSPAFVLADSVSLNRVAITVPVCLGRKPDFLTVVPGYRATQDDIFVALALTAAKGDAIESIPADAAIGNGVSVALPIG